MHQGDLAEVVERLVVAGVGLTTRALAEASPGLDVTFPQWRVLLVLGDEPDGATVSEVAARVGVTLPATSRQLRRLERRGLVSIAPDELDRRAVRSRLTAHGAATRTAILSYRRDRIAETTDRLPVSPTVLRQLERIAEAFDRYR